jgi:hypothetical protein
MFGRGRVRGWFSRDAEPARAAAAGLGLAAPDVAELSAIGALVAEEYGISSPAVLSANLTRLLRRRVPVRALRAAGVRSVGGLQFADGTVVLVRGRHIGDLGRLAAGLHYGPVQLADFHADRDHVTLELSYNGHRDELSVLGVTQPS